MYPLLGDEDMNENSIFCQENCVKVCLHISIRLKKILCLGYCSCYWLLADYNSLTIMRVFEAKIRPSVFSV